MFAGIQESNKRLTIEGKPPVDMAEKAAAITADLKEATSMLEPRSKEIKIAPSYGVGDKMGVIAKANKVFIKGEE